MNPIVTHPATVLVVAAASPVHDVDALVLAAIAADDAARRRPRPTLAARVYARVVAAIVAGLDAVAVLVADVRDGIAAEHA